MVTYDILIKSGTIIDGTGNPRYQGDIGIQGGRIKDVALVLPKAEAAKTINASGRFVAPGFIDLSSHADANWSLFLNPQQDYLLTQGVTTILAGNCGSSLAPLVSPEAVESLKKWGELAEVNINWTSVGEFLEELARRPLGVNVATLIGHGTLRRGLTRGATRRFSPEELAQAMQLVEQGQKEGAVGFSLGLAYSHEAPATHDELTAMARVIARQGGLMKVHLRSESLNLVPAVNEVVQLARESGARVVISHLKAIGRRSWPFFRKALDMIDRARGSGLELSFDISPYQRTGSFLYQLLPAWVREGGFDQMFKRIQDEAMHKQVIADLEALSLHYEKLVVATSITPNTNGRTVHELAERAGRSPAEVLLDLLIANRGRVTIFGRALSFRNLTIGLTHSAAMIASDGSGVFAEYGRSGKLVHPRSTGAFPHFLHRFVREKELIPWEEGIAKITHLPAQALGMQARGRLAKGLVADIVVFDPEDIRDRSTYQNPYVHSTGIDAVIVNGKLAVESGQLTGVSAGQVLKKSS